MRKIVFMVFVMGFFPAVLKAEELRALPMLTEKPTFAEAMVGEEYRYDIAFLWFDRLAEGRFSFARGDEPDTFRAVLEARTLGVAAWLTRDRIQRYVSVMKRRPDGRFRSMIHESRIIKGKGEDREDRGKRYTFDYEAGEVRLERFLDEQFDREQVLPLAPEKPPNDVLTAFFNFRSGFFGPIAPGRIYTIPAFSRKGEGNIVVNVLTDEQREKHTQFPPEGTLIEVNVDPEIFDTGDGSIYVWFDESGRPAKGIVEGVVGMGNVLGTLRQ